MIEELPPSDPLFVCAFPPLVLDLITAGHTDLPAERCVDDCLALAYAYAQLGLTAQIRVAELAVTDRRTGQTAVHGSLTPWWQDGLLHGHTVVWLPGPRCLVDSTISQYVNTAGPLGGSVVALADDDADDGEITVVDTTHAGQYLHYVLAPRVASTAVLAHPTIGDTDTPYHRFGTNIAAAVISYLTENLPAASTADLSVRRTAALVEAVRGLPPDRTIEGDHRFIVCDSEGGRRSVSLDEIALPSGTPAVRRVTPLPGWR